MENPGSILSSFHRCENDQNEREDADVEIRIGHMLGTYTHRVCVANYNNVVLYATYEAMSHSSIACDIGMPFLGATIIFCLANDRLKEKDRKMAK